MFTHCFILAEIEGCLINDLFETGWEWDKSEKPLFIDPV